MNFQSQCNFDVLSYRQVLHSNVQLNILLIQLLSITHFEQERPPAVASQQPTTTRPLPPSSPPPSSLWRHQWWCRRTTANQQRAIKCSSRTRSKGRGTTTTGEICFCYVIKTTTGSIFLFATSGLPKLFIQRAPLIKTKQLWPLVLSSYEISHKLPIKFLKIIFCILSSNQEYLV